MNRGQCWEMMLGPHAANQMPRQPSLIRLPDGTAVWAANALEAAILYHELGEQMVYGRHGIAVNDGDCVFDVGANIGLYSLLLLRAHGGLRIFAFEPAPSVYALLERNTAPYRADGVVTLFNCALGREAGTAEGVVERGLSFAASLRPADVTSAARSDARLIDWVQALTADLARLGLLPRGAERMLQRGLALRALRPLAVPTVLALAAATRLRTGGFGKRRFSCDVRSLSEVILSHNVARIDLLKIDVEGSEWEVLSGLTKALWGRVRQAVVEVHDVAGRVGDVARLFAEHGFRTEVDQEDWAVHRLMGIHTVYARREP